MPGPRPAEPPGHRTNRHTSSPTLDVGDTCCRYTFWLGVVDRYRGEIDRGLGRALLPVLMRELDDFMGPRCEEAFRLHLRRLEAKGDLGDDIVAVGPFWTGD